MPRVHQWFRKFAFVLACGFLIPMTALSADVFPPKHVTVDLKPGDARMVTLTDGSKIHVGLIGLEETRDSVRNAMRSALVKVKIETEEAVITAAPYSLPVRVGKVRIDVPVTSGYLTDTTIDHWKLAEGASVRLRIWPADGPLSPERFAYPVRQGWFASGTQMANEPTFVDGGEDPASKKVYYHSGLDIGGPEGLAEVVAATDGLIVSLGNKKIDGLETDTPVAPRYDVIYLRDSRGWYYRYSHLQRFAPGLKTGDQVRKGQSLGVLGKEGGSGGWAHLHFEIKARQPSGKYGTEEGYAFLWEAGAANQPLVAVARPHKFVRVGEPFTLDAGRSHGLDGPLSYEWTLPNGDSASQSTITSKFDRPGHFSAILKVTDAKGREAYDFCVVQVVNPERPGELPPSIQAAYWPSLGIKPSTPVTFLVRTFRTTDGEEKWNFGDGSPEVLVRSDGNAETHAPDGFAATVHRFTKPGDYLVTVVRTNARGESATAHLHVHVEETLR
ncbi:peptidoglycan DD-metalloendopeptidase family protein [bacterium]|nr:peptidoglycan DD-metalloendopeptidase family protein [bacterium]